MRQHDDDPEPGFYQNAFWWMMGLGGAGIAGSIIMAVQLNVAVARLETQLESISDNYHALLVTVEKASGDRYTSTTAAADKRESVGRLETIEATLRNLQLQVTDIRLWQASQAEKGLK